MSAGPGEAFGTRILPWCVFSPPGGTPRVGVGVGEEVLDAAAVLGEEVFARPTLAGFLAAGRPAWEQARERIGNALADPGSPARRAGQLYPVGSVRLHLPLDVGDYVDFYSSLEHATNLGAILRPGAEPLPAAWRHLPIGYHGRSGTIVVSGTPVRRPAGLRAGPDGPSYGPCRRLDFEAEIGFVVGTPSTLGEPVPVSGFADHVFGIVVLNDWSARDIQAFEYVPLGPFLGKSFATSISPWVVPLAALQTARVPAPDQQPEPAAYLRRGENWGLDLQLQISINGDVISRPPFAGMYWTPDQQLAHLTANGASVRTGDIFASGTVSGSGPAEQGSLIELTANGSRPLSLADGGRLAFLRDGDTVQISATLGGGARKVGLGSVSGRVEGRVGVE